MDSSRYFPNEIFDVSLLNESDPQIINLISIHFNKLLAEINEHIRLEASDYSIYTGLCGIGLLHYFLWRRGGDEAFLKSASDIVSRCNCADGLRGKRFTFLCGDAGPLSLNAVISHHLKNEHRKKHSLALLANLMDQALGTDNPDELLYGRCGLLYAFLFCRHEIQDKTLFKEEIGVLFETIINSGLIFAQNEMNSVPPLMWQWHGKKYLGAAHGVCGIIHTLLLTIRSEPELLSKFSSVKNDIISTIDWILSQTYESGNLMSSVGSHSGDKLVQWCHGAPALIGVLLTVDDIFDLTSPYFEKAKLASEVVWQRGLLKKGFGICHGSSGNAYSFLALYKKTGDVIFLRKAYSFASWASDARNQWLNDEPDRPFSLFEGRAGTAWFLADLLFGNSKTFTFPAYELITV